MEKEMYDALCNQYRVYCLSEKPDVPLLWAHYARAHTGICLEFDAGVPPFSVTEQVQYLSAYPARDLVTIGYEPLVTKSDDWSYEAEWRLIAEERSFAQSPLTLKTENDFLTLPAGTVKSVTIGCLANEASRQRIEALVKANAPDVLVRQATLAPDSYGLLITPASS
jgi:hypothetical protein